MPKTIFVMSLDSVRGYDEPTPAAILINRRLRAYHHHRVAPVPPDTLETIVSTHQIPHWLHSHGVGRRHEKPRAARDRAGLVRAGVRVG